MATFTVSQIIDGDTFAVSPKWKWNGEIGDRVRPTGYDTPELGTADGKAAKQKLECLILNQQIELGKVATLDRGRLVCDVFFNGHNLADYFRDYAV